jgi:hypothetical protein
MELEFGMSHSLKIVQLASHPSQCAVAKAHYPRENLLESDELTKREPESTPSRAARFLAAVFFIGTFGTFL